MPHYDGTGPLGDGRPGRGLGPCGRFGRIFGRGPGFGCGFGRGYRWGLRNRFRGNWSYWPFDPASRDSAEMYRYNKSSLEAEKHDLEEQLKWLNCQLAKLKDENS